MEKSIQEINNIRKANILSSFASKTSKKECSANIIQNEKGEILLLKRSSLDSFHGGTWCLAGGGIDPGETPLEAVKRETSEEAGIDPDSYRIMDYAKIAVKDANLHYFRSFLLDGSEPFVTLDETEHCQYQWCDDKTWLELDLILQLKDHLIDILKIKFV